MIGSGIGGLDDLRTSLILKERGPRRVSHSSSRRH